MNKSASISKNDPLTGKSKPRPGGRSAHVRQAVLAATLDVLAERGYEAMSVSEIATRAGVNETSIFRRWGTKASVAADALQSYSAMETPTPDTGSLRTDLVELLSGIIARTQTPLGQVISHIVLGSNTQPELEELQRSYWKERFDKAALVIQRAKARGELSEEVEAEFLLEAAIGPILVRGNATKRPLDEQLPVRIVDLLLFGIAKQDKA